MNRPQRIYWWLPLLMIGIASCSEKNPGNVVGDELEGLDTTLFVSLADVYDVMPEMASCRPGVITTTEQMRVIAYINELRGLHNLPPVVHDPTHDEHARMAAMIIAANDYLSHSPPDSLECWSEIGRLGSQKSNLAWAAHSRIPSGRGFSSNYMVDSWWKDSAVEFVGHRRWLLDPFLQQVSFGRADRSGEGNTYSTTAAALWVIDDTPDDPTTFEGDFVAWPFEDYPAELYNDDLSMSFSAIVDHDNYWANQGVDLVTATVTITDDLGLPVQVRNLRYAVDAFGTPNVLVWEADLQEGVRYEVKVEGVVYDGGEKDYTYWVRFE